MSKQRCDVGEVGCGSLYWVLGLSLLVLANSAQGATEPTDQISEELLLLKEETSSIAIGLVNEQPISQAPSNVYVLTDEDIRHSGAIDLPTLLRRIPGMEVIQTTGAQFDVSVRGDNQLISNKMLVMVDGRSIYIDAQGGVLWKLLPVTLPEIKRIEVLKGPASVLYGFNAFDGVINIITKSPEEIKGTTLQVGGGEFGTLTSSAIQAGTYKKFGYRFSVGRDQTNQWDDRNALAFRAHKFNLLTEYALTAQSKLSLTGGLVDANRFDGQRVATAFPDTTPQQGYANVSYERPNFFIRAWWQGFYTTTDFRTHPLLARFLRTTDRDFSSIDKTRANSYNIDAQHAVDLASVNRLTYGINYRNNILSDNFIAAASREERLGFYVQDEWHMTEVLTLVAGVRYDLHTEINGTFSPRVAALYQLAPGHTLRASVSVAYRPPTLIERNLDSRAVATVPTGLPPPFPATITSVVPTLGSANLRPEEIVSYEVGYQGWFWKHRLRLRADLFLNHISDLISFPQIGATAIAVNGQEADIYGGEAGVEVLATRWLTGFANYAYQEFGQTFTGATQRGMPRMKVNAGLRGEWENGVNGEIALHHYGAATYPVSSAFATFAPFYVPLGAAPPATRVGSYNLLNVRIAYRLWREKAEVAVTAFNALNDRHREHPLGDVIGSRVMGWLTLRF